MYEKYRSDLLNIAWVLVPSLIFSFVVHSLVMCIDPLLVQWGEKMVPRQFRSCLRAGWLLSFGVGLLWAWNIPPGSYLFYWHEALPFSPPSVLVSLAVAVLVLLWLQFYRGADYKSARLSRTLPAIGLVLLGVKAIGGLGLLDAQWIRQNLKSPAIGLVRTVYYMSDTMQAQVQGTPAATFNAFVRGQQLLPPKIVAMVVESWGERPNSLKQIAASIQSEHLRIVASGFTAYRGSTLSGEFRELCSKYLSPSDELKDESFRLDCAPTFLQSQGYRTSGLHGYQKDFYARGTLWERFGIMNRLFTEDLSELERCPGAFDGTCDAALIKRGIGVLDRDTGPSFVYMLTLSGHEPLAPSALMHPAPMFKRIDVTHPTQVVSRRAIADLVDELARKPDRPCTLVYIAGDHQPPSASSQSGIFQSGQVPFLALTYNCPATRRKLAT